MEQLPPDRPILTGILKVVEGASAYIPVAGPAIQVGLAWTFGWALGYRREHWLARLQAEVEDLQQQIGDTRTWEELAQDDAFVDVVFQATSYAQMTAKEEKLEALRNGVLNSLASDSWDEVERARFLRIVDEFTPAQMRLLHVLHDPKAARAALGLPEPEIRESRNWYWGELQTFPEFQTQEGIQLSDMLMDDLRRHLLVAVTHERQTMYGGDGRQTTDLGERFLRFISPPELPAS